MNAIPMSSSTTFQLSELITSNNVADWLNANTKQITFNIQTNASFALFAEGPAVSAIHQLVAMGTRLHVALTFEPTFLRGNKYDSVLETLFGLTLLKYSDSFSTPAAGLTRDDIFTAIWKRISGARGETGDANRRYLVIREPDASMPIESEFLPFVSRSATALGVKPANTFAASWMEISRFLYETALNSYDHGRIGNDRIIGSGYRGLIVEKLIRERERGILSLDLLPQAGRNYLDRIYKTTYGRDRVIIAYSVVDYGLGIQHTLPTQPDESNWQRLNRAFRPGESRFPPGTAVGRGEGLTKAIAFNAMVKPFLFLQSAELAGTIDFSAGYEVASILTAHEPVKSLGRGTSLTLLWPSDTSSTDQLPLFDGK